MIALNNITKSYRTKHGRHYIFRNLTLNIPHGSNIGIIGPTVQASLPS